MTARACRKRTFLCDCCHGRFEESQSEREALIEQNHLFPGLKTSERVKVCEPCFKKIIAWAKEKGLVPNAR
jgi:hypothetical protein